MNFILAIGTTCFTSTYSSYLQSESCRALLSLCDERPLSKTLCTAALMTVLGSVSVRFFLDSACAVMHFNHKEDVYTQVCDQCCKALVTVTQSVCFSHLLCVPASAGQHQVLAHYIPPQSDASDLAHLGRSALQTGKGAAMRRPPLLTDLSATGLTQRQSKQSIKFHQANMRFVTTLHG